MRSIFFAALIGVLGCKSKDGDPAPPPPPSAPPRDVTADATAVAPVAIDAAAAAADERCASPCRFLADTALAEVATKVKSACNAEWPEPSAKDCAQLDYQRNCIYATAGYTFKKKLYQDAFGKEAWYKARADFKEADLSTTAIANVAELKKRAGDCRTGEVIDARDRKIVDAWLAGLRAGKPALPDILIDVTKDSFKDGMLADKATFAPKRQNGMRYRELADLRADWAPPLKGKPVRKIVEVDFSDSDSRECPENEECGYGLWVVLVIDDKNKIIGLEVGMAACPVVYLGDALQGEIIRNFDEPAREATQHLAVTAPCGGSGRVTYRIAEEKRETSQLDEVVLVIGDEVILPDVDALRANDGRYATLARGESLAVTFDIPAGLPCGGARLRANGHYVPN